jgi:hypothetical protein
VERLTWILRGNPWTGDWSWLRASGEDIDRIERHVRAEYSYCQRLDGGWTGHIERWSDEPRLSNPFSVLRGYMFPVNLERLDQSLRERGVVQSRVDENEVVLLLASSLSVMDALRNQGGVYGHLGYECTFRLILDEWRLTEFSVVESERVPEPGRSGQPVLVKRDVEFVGDWSLTFNGEVFRCSERRVWSDFFRIGSLVLPARCVTLGPRSAHTSVVRMESLVELTEADAERALRFSVPTSWTGRGRLTNMLTGSEQAFDGGLGAQPETLITNASGPARAWLGEDREDGSLVRIGLLAGGGALAVVGCFLLLKFFRQRRADRKSGN